MNHYETNNDGTLVNPAPLFASVWLALFHVLRRRYNDRCQAAATNTKKPGTQE